MALISICKDFLPNPLLNAAERIGHAGTSLGTTIHTLREKTHTIFRNFLLTTLGALRWNQDPPKIVKAVDIFKEKSYDLFGTNDTLTSELAAMISALRAKALILSEMKRKSSCEEDKGLVAKTYNCFFSTLVWLEKKEASLSFSEMREKVSKKIDEIWELKTSKKADLVNTHLFNIKFEERIYSLPETVPEQQEATL